MIVKNSLALWHKRRRCPWRSLTNGVDMGDQKKSVAKPSVSPINLVLRCYAVNENDVWSAVCINFSLAAQGNSFADAKRKLNAQIGDYVKDAFTVDREHADYLLNRKAPLAQRLTWYALLVRSNLHALKSASARLFTQPLPVVPCNV